MEQKGEFLMNKYKVCYKCFTNSLSSRDTIFRETVRGSICDECFEVANIPHASWLTKVLWWLRTYVFY